MPRGNEHTPKKAAPKKAKAPARPIRPTVARQRELESQVQMLADLLQQKN